MDQVMDSDNEQCYVNRQNSNILFKMKNFFSFLWSIMFILGPATVLLIAFRNSLTWHLQNFWGASADFWQSQWQNVLDGAESLFGKEHFEFRLLVFGSVIFSLIVYWGVGSIYMFLDITNKPAFLRKYKIQPGTNEPVDLRKLKKVAGHVLFNQICVGLPVNFAFYYLMQWRGGIKWGRELPNFETVVFQLIGCILVEEIGFYYAHRMFHHPTIYKHIHKLHHEWTAPIAITAVYCHPLEQTVANLMPVIAGIFIFNLHVATSWLWIAIVIMSTLNAHSGYHFPFFPSPEAHDFHHLKFNQCFGVLGVLDLLHGTDVGFRESVQGTRHLMHLSLVPLSEAYPKGKGKTDSKQC